MVKLEPFVKALEENSDMALLIEQIRTGNLSIPSPKEIETHLASLPEKERTRVQALLVNTIESLSSYTSQLEKDQEETKKQMEITLDSRRACESYEVRQDGNRARKK